MPRYADLSRDSAEEIALWERLAEGAGKTYLTVREMPFSYSLCGNMLLISRKSKPITRATVNETYRRARELSERDGHIPGPKALGTFGASYLYPIFLALGIIQQ